MSHAESTGLDETRCPATSKQTGKQCGAYAGAGTDHKGSGLCKHHGGLSPGGVVQAQNIDAVKAVAQFGLPREIDPHQALIEELHRAAGWVAWLEARVVSEGPGKLQQMGPFGPYESHWNQLLTRERATLAAIAQACIKAGVEERRVRVVEQGAQFAATAIRAAFTHLGLDLESPKVKQAVTAALQVVPAA